MSNSLIRPEIINIPAYVPGARPANSKVWKLSSNELPFPPLPAVQAAVRETLGQLHRYPPMMAQDVGLALCEQQEQLGFPSGTLLPQNVVVGGASLTVIEAALQAVCRPGDEVVFGWRSFEAYPISAQATGAKARMVPLNHQHCQDVDTLIEAVTEKTRVLIVCVPNNPTGTILTQSQLRYLAKQLPPEIILVVDEAYYEFALYDQNGVKVSEPPSATSLLLERENIILLRTFSKAFGLAGIRIGWAATSAQLATAIYSVITPFSTTVASQVAALAALKCLPAVHQRVRWVCKERGRVLSGLADMGYEIPPSAANFIWIPLGEKSADFTRYCLENDLLVRGFADFGVRVTIGEAGANDAFLSVAKQYFG